MAEDSFPGWHGTTIIGVKKDGKIVVAGDGQVSLGQTVIKGTARKVRRLSPGEPPMHSPCLNGLRPSLRQRPVNWPAQVWNWPKTGAQTNTFKSLRRC